MFERNKIKRKMRVCFIMMAMFGALLLLGLLLAVGGGADPLQTVVLPLLGVIASAIAFFNYKRQAAADVREDWPED